MRIHSIFMMTLSVLLMTACAATMDTSDAAATAGGFGVVGIEGDWFTVDGERFLVVGVGYEVGDRPGEMPWSHGDHPEWLRADFQRIREAGFNTIRTWSPLSDEDLDLAEEYGLWVIQGIWVKSDADFTDERFQEESLALIRREVARSKRHRNILCYLLMNEPQGKAVHLAGKDRVLDFFRRMSAAAREADPARPCSFSNCVFTDYLASDPWPVVCQNAYPYSPDTIRRALGFGNYLEKMKATRAPGKPFVVTEFGLSVSPSGDGRGYGGNSLEEQRDGDVRLWDSVVNSGAAGGCVFMWIDGWWKHGNESMHDDHAEEWYGLLASDADPIGLPRPAYYALKEYNEAIRTSPHEGQMCGQGFPLEVWAPHAARAQYRIDSAPWQNLAKQGTWWRGEGDIQNCDDGWALLETRGLDRDGVPRGKKRCWIWIAREGAPASPGLQLRILPPSSPVSAGEMLRVEVEAMDRSGLGVAGIPVRVECFLHTDWYENGVDGVTDDQGRTVVKLRLPRQPGVLSIAAGASLPATPFAQRFGDYCHIEVTANKPAK